MYNCVTFLYDYVHLTIDCVLQQTLSTFNLETDSMDHLIECEVSNISHFVKLVEDVVMSEQFSCIKDKAVDGTATLK